MRPANLPETPPAAVLPAGPQRDDTGKMEPQTPPLRTRDTRIETEDGATVHLHGVGLGGEHGDALPEVRRRADGLSLVDELHLNTSERA